MRAPKSDDASRTTPRGRGQNMDGRAALLGAGVDASSANQAAPLLAQGQQQRYDTAGLDTEHAYQQARLDELRDVEAATREVHGLFADFKQMTDAQQVGIDTVDKNVDKTRDHIAKGTGELKEASETQQCTRKMMCGIVCVIVVVVAIVIIVLYSMKKM